MPICIFLALFCANSHALGLGDILPKDDSENAHQYTKEDYSRFCSLNMVNIYSIVSGKCLNKLIIEYDNIIKSVDIDPINYVAFELFLKTAIARNRDMAQDIVDVIPNINIGTRRIVITALTRSVGIKPASDMLGMSTQSLRRGKIEVFDAKAMNALSMRRKARNVQDWRHNMERSAYAWALFSATGNIYTLAEVLTYVPGMPRIAIRLYGEYLKSTDAYEYGIIPLLARGERVQSIIDFLKSKKGEVDKYNSQFLPTATEIVNIWDIASYITVLDQLHMNTIHYKDIALKLQAIEDQYPRYKRFYRPSNKTRRG